VPVRGCRSARQLRAGKGSVCSTCSTCAPLLVEQVEHCCPPSAPPPPLIGGGAVVEQRTLPDTIPLRHQNCSTSEVAAMCLHPSRGAHRRGSRADDGRRSANPPCSSNGEAALFGTRLGNHAWVHAECWPAWYAARKETAIARFGISDPAPITPDGFTTRVMYAADGEKREGLAGAWHPRLGTSKLVIGDFRA
jgi:hypothetical protein